MDSFAPADRTSRANSIFFYPINKKKHTLGLLFRPKNDKIRMYYKKKKKKKNIFDFSIFFFIYLFIYFLTA